MSSWGTALYSNDTSCDVRDMCNEVYPLVGTEEGTRLILAEFCDIANSNLSDNDHADFWFALADWQWKHGILTDEIKNKALSLLEVQAGIEEWKESGTPVDVKNRLACMAELRKQLEIPQPEMKIPKAKIVKPKHKPGDIIIVKTGLKENDPDNWIWNIDHCRQPSYIYSQEISDKISETISHPYDAHDKYIAILCVGTEKTPHSQYVDGIFDEYSVYAFYDYISKEEPTVNTLKTCGFVPKYLQYASETGITIETSGWCYKFHLFTYSFKVPKDGCEQSIKKSFDKDEAIRFHTLLDAKNYLPDTSWNHELFEAFEEFFAEKIQLDAANIKYDNLLDPYLFNPALRPKNEISAIIKREIDELD